jgi:hypothetical protein
MPVQMDPVPGGLAFDRRRGWRAHRRVLQAEQGRHRPPTLALDGLLAIPRLSSPRFGELPKPRIDYRPTGNHYSREEVIAAVGTDKFGIATKEWGLKAASYFPNANGWISCFVPGREDPKRSHPSGSFCWRDGTFQDRKDNKSISFFDLAVVLGKYARWQDCRDDLGQRYIGKRGVEATHKHAY